MVQQRKRIKHTQTFEERLEEEAHKYREAAARQPPGSMARELLLRRAQKIETAFAPAAARDRVRPVRRDRP